MGEDRLNVEMIILTKQNSTLSVYSLPAKKLLLETQWFVRIG